MSDECLKVMFNEFFGNALEAGCIIGNWMRCLKIDSINIENLNDLCRNINEFTMYLEGCMLTHKSDDLPSIRDILRYICKNYKGRFSYICENYKGMTFFIMIMVWYNNDVLGGNCDEYDIIDLYYELEGGGVDGE